MFFQESNGSKSYLRANPLQAEGMDRNEAYWNENETGGGTAGAYHQSGIETGTIPLEFADEKWVSKAGNALLEEVEFDIITLKIENKN